MNSSVETLHSVSDKGGLNRKSRLSFIGCYFNHHHYHQRVNSKKHLQSSGTVQHKLTLWPSLIVSIRPQVELECVSCCTELTAPQRIRWHLALNTTRRQRLLTTRPQCKQRPYSCVYIACMQCTFGCKPIPDDINSIFCRCIIYSFITHEAAARLQVQHGHRRPIERRKNKSQQPLQFQSDFETSLSYWAAFEFIRIEFYW